MLKLLKSHSRGRIIEEQRPRRASDILKVSKEVFSAETSSCLSTDRIKCEIERVLNLMGIEYRPTNPFFTQYECEDASRDVKFVIEICRIENLEGLKGVKLHKKKGKKYDWAATQENIHSLLKL